MRFPLLVLLAAVTLAAGGCGGARHPADPKATLQRQQHPRRAHTKPKPAGPFAHALGRSHLAPGSDPSVLPGDVLIADRSNDRLLVVDPHGRIVWRFPAPGKASLPLPDDAFFSPDGRRIVVTEEDVDVVSVIDVASRRIVWRYGATGVPGSTTNRLAHPDDAMSLPDGSIVAADIENCRLVLLRPPSHRPAHTSGSPADGCIHAPPRAWASPNGAFPLVHGGMLVTEINGDWSTRSRRRDASSGRRIRPASPIRPTRTRFGPGSTSPSAGRAPGSSRRSTGTAGFAGVTTRDRARRSSTTRRSRCPSRTATTCSTTTPTTA